MKTVVVTLAVGRQAQRLLSISGPIFEGYARRIGADFRVIDSPRISPTFPMAAKFQCGKYLEVGWDRLIYFDADVLLSQKCENLFDVVPEDSAGIYDETLHFSDLVWADEQYAALAASQGWDVPRPPHNLNTGVIVCSREHAAMFDPPTRPYPKSHTAEQSLIGLNVVRHGIKLHPLEEKFNYQRWAHPKDFEYTEADVLHFSGMVATPERRQAEMEARARAMGYSVTPSRPAPPKRVSLVCGSLGKRIEFRADCASGRMCRHECNSTLPAVLEYLGGVAVTVPGEDCGDECPGYVARENPSAV